MGGGALIQLVAKGAQDLYLTGDPQITFFKLIYKRHTNFSKESIRQDISGLVHPGSKISVTISRNGDLLSGITLQYKPKNLIIDTNNQIANICNNLGHSLFKEFQLEIGGIIVDTQYGKWLTIWRDLTINTPSHSYTQNSSGLEPLFANSYDRMSYNYLTSGNTNLSSAPTEAYVPLQFWFCKNPGLALPLIALQYHEVVLNIILAEISELVTLKQGVTNTNLIKHDFDSIQIYGEYIYLDSSERRKFAENSHEYLIEQLQFQNFSDYSNNEVNNSISIPLFFKNTLKEIIFSGSPLTNNIGTTETIIKNSLKDSADCGNYTNVNATISFNKLYRMSLRNLKYFTRNQIWDYHSGDGSYIIDDSIGVYSFALRPEEHQPSGTCNFSRINNPILFFNNFSSTESLNSLDIYAVSYNIFRINSGMGAIVYAS